MKKKATVDQTLGFRVDGPLDGPIADASAFAFSFADPGSGSTGVDTTTDAPPTCCTVSVSVPWVTSALPAAALRTLP